LCLTSYSLYLFLERKELLEVPLKLTVWNKNMSFRKNYNYLFSII